MDAVIKRKAWIFDVDGTLANVDSVLHYIVNENNQPNFQKDFNKFHENAVNVPAHHEVIDMLWEAMSRDRAIIVVTARKEEWRAHTSYWLSKNGAPHDALFMRGKRDNRSDYEVKKDILEHINLFWDVEHAIDDNPKIIKLWEENGIHTTKIGNWDGE
jgi:phosphoglycolate phosphatase-like HAD superfamily hydrolase